MLRASAAFAVLLVTAISGMTGSVGPIATPDPIEVSDVPEITTIRGMQDRFGHLFPAQPFPEGMTPEETRTYLLSERAVLGRAPLEWVDWIHETFNLDLPAMASAAHQDLVPNVLRIYAAVGRAASGQEIEEIEAAAAAVPAELRGPFADLVGAVATAYEAQLPIVDDVLSRWPPTDVATPFLRTDQRDSMAASAKNIVDAINRFREEAAAVPSSVKAVACPIFADPEGLVILGGTCNDAYAPGAQPLPDPVLLVELGGNDVYTNSAGGANPLGYFTGSPLIPSASNPLPGGNHIALSVLLDIAGDDDYTYNGAPSVVQGAGSVGGMGLLVDVDGADEYRATMTRSTVGPLSVTGYLDGGGQGHGYIGLGLLLDAWGDDVYDFNIASSSGRCAWAFAQGFGGGGGIGINSDLDGVDQWLSDGLGIPAGATCFGGVGGSLGFLGLYTQGVGFFGGVGIMSDTGGDNDIYHSYNSGSTVDYYAQGFGAFGGLGILYEDAGDDDYEAVETATNAFINPLLNCAYGTGSLGGVGVMVDGAGNDNYLINTVSDKSADTMTQGDGAPIPAYGIFFDGDGVDEHIALASSTGSGVGRVFGRGVLDLNMNLAGAFFDTGGDADIYTPAGLGSNNDQWLFGADV